MHDVDACLGDGRFGLALLGVGSGFGALWTLSKCMPSDGRVDIPTDPRWIFDEAIFYSQD